MESIMQIVLHVGFLSKEFFDYRFSKKKCHCWQLILQKEYAKCQMLFCGQEDVSKTYPSVETSASFCEFQKFEKSHTQFCICQDLGKNRGQRAGNWDDLRKQSGIYSISCEVTGIFRILYTEPLLLIFKTNKIKVTTLWPPQPA